jgi:hypothetical protein
MLHKFSIGVVLALFFFINANAQNLINTPAPSPAATIKQKIGLAEATITYNRPSAKGREVFGKLVPFNEAWRTGANGSTVLTIDAELKIEGKPLPAGSYGIYTIPTKDSWTVVFNKNTKAGGDMGAYKGEDDVLKLSVPTKAYGEMVETFTIEFSDVTESSASLKFVWEKTKVSLKIEQDVKGLVMKQIENFEKNPMRTVSNAYFSAAGYFLSADTDMPKALEYVNKAIELKYDMYWVYRTKSLIQAKLKDYKGAIESAKISAQKAKEGEDNHYVRMNEESIAEWSKMK